VQLSPLAPAEEAAAAAPFDSLTALRLGLDEWLEAEARRRREARLALLHFLTRPDVFLLSGADSSASARVTVGEAELDRLAQLDTAGVGWLGPAHHCPGDAGAAAAAASASADPTVLDLLRVLNGVMHVHCASVADLTDTLAQAVRLVREDKAALHGYFGTDVAAAGADAHAVAAAGPLSPARDSGRAASHPLLDGSAALDRRAVDQLYAALTLTPRPDPAQDAAAAAKAAAASPVWELQDLMENLQTLESAGARFSSMRSLEAELQRRRLHAQAEPEPAVSSAAARVASSLVAAATVGSAAAAHPADDDAPAFTGTADDAPVPAVVVTPFLPSNLRPLAVPDPEGEDACPEPLQTPLHSSRIYEVGTTRLVSCTFNHIYRR